MTEVDPILRVTPTVEVTTEERAQRVLHFGNLTVYMSTQSQPHIVQTIDASPDDLMVAGHELNRTLTQEQGRLMQARKDARALAIGLPVGLGAMGGLCGLTVGLTDANKQPHVGFKAQVTEGLGGLLLGATLIASLIALEMKAMKRYGSNNDHVADAEERLQKAQDKQDYFNLLLNSQK